MSFKAIHTANLEHANISVANPDKTATLLCNLFNWKVRWSGASMDGGYTVHVGSEQSYLALYNAKSMQENTYRSHTSLNNLNHIGIVVDDLNAYEEKARELGLKPESFKDYHVNKSFYVTDEFGLEIEIISYL